MFLMPFSQSDKPVKTIHPQAARYAGGCWLMLLFTYYPIVAHATL